MRGHVRVTILTERLPAKWSEAIHMFTTLLSMFIIAIMCWQGIVVAYEASGEKMRHFSPRILDFLDPYLTLPLSEIVDS